MKKRRIFSIVILFALLDTVIVSAAANNRMIQKCVVSKNLIQLYTCVEDSKNAEYSAKLSDIELSQPDTELAEADAVTWYILLDISGSMQGTPFDCAREVIRTLSENMAGDDNMVISTMGDIITPSPYMTDPAEIASYIAKLEVTSEDTNLYTGIVKSMQELLSNTRVNTKKCLVVFSDGHNDQDKGSNDGSTEEEATSIIKEQTVPVFTIATLYENPSKEANKYAKILGSFARNSVGGKHYVPVVENISGSDIGLSIVKNMRKTQKLTFELNQLSDEVLLQLEQKDRNILTLRLSCLVDGEKRYEDTTDIYWDDLDVREVAATTVEPETETESMGQTEQETQEESEVQTDVESASGETSALSRKNVIGLVVGAAILIVILLVWIRKKKKPDDENDNKDGNEKTDGNITVDENDNSNNTGEDKENDGSASDTAVTPPAYKMHIFVIGDSSVRYQYLFDINKPFTLGRDDRSDMKLLQNGRKLSGQNCQLLYDGKQMYLKDISMNGTVVDGVKLVKNQPVILKNDSKVRMGSYEYRLTWTRNE